MVAEDNRGGIQVEGAEIVDPTAHTLAVAAFRPGGTPFGPVAHQDAMQDRGRRPGINEEAATLAVAARAAGAANGLIMNDDAIADGQTRVSDLSRAFEAGVKSGRSLPRGVG